MKNVIFCFIALLIFTLSFAETEIEKTSSTTIKLMNTAETISNIIIKIKISDNEVGKLAIFNIKGQKIFDAQYNSGEYRISLKKSEFGTGLLFYKLKTNCYFKSGKIIMLK